MTHILAFANQKGGVGKTTSCVNVAAVLAAKPFRVLVIDLDPQGNATMGSGVHKLKLEYSMNEFLQGQADFKQSCFMQTPAGYDLLPANRDLTAAEIALLKKPNHHFCLRDLLAPVRDNYDFILIDCPPSLNVLTLNAFCVATHLLITMQCEYYALEGLSDLMNTFTQIKENLNPNFKLLGILRTMFDTRSRLCLEVSEQLADHFGNTLFQTTIPRNVRLAEAPSHGLPAMLYDRTCRGATAYVVFTHELLKRLQKVTPKATPTEIVEETVA